MCKKKGRKNTFSKSQIVHRDCNVANESALRICEQNKGINVMLHGLTLCFVAENIVGL